MIATTYHEDLVDGKKVCRFPGDVISLKCNKHMQMLVDDGLATESSEDEE